MKYKNLVFVLIVLSLSTMYSQTRDFIVQKRGMLHQTIFNTGELGRAYDQGQGGTSRGIPSFEWPGDASTIVDGVAYVGQNNSFGGGMYLAANRPDTIGRLYAFCGGAGSGTPEAVENVYSFPIELSRQENYPVLANGQLNPSYNPNEAEEMIVSKWATPLGLTITRTSRSWSTPDYDDFIIYEYEIENTGDRDGKSATPAYTDTLNDVMIAFAYGFTPSQFGYERTYNRWNYVDFENGDLRARFDRNRWLNYTIDSDGKPDRDYYSKWALSQVNGGGLLSPQAVGFAMLYYDTTHLALPTETNILINSSDAANIWDNHNHLKQPYLNRLETSNMRISKVQPYLDVQLNRKNNPYRNPLFGPDWIGRGSFNVRQSQYFAVGRILVFGPYKMNPGEKIKFALAEVAGYGAARKSQTDAGLTDEGGSCGQNCGEDASLAAFNPVPNWTDTISYGGHVYGHQYLNQYALPPYVNSTSTVTIREVTDRAIQAYSGANLANHDSIPYWPEQSPNHGVYQIPVPVPNPAIVFKCNEKAQNLISWSNAVESFTSPSLQSPLGYYEVYRAEASIGPWTRLDSIGIADPRFFIDGTYTIKDSIPKVSESFYYAVVSVGQDGRRNSKSNKGSFKTYLGAVAKLGKVTVVPNPFVVRSGFSGNNSSTDVNSTIAFYGLTTVCTIRIYSYSGQMVNEIQHNDGTNVEQWFQVSRNNQKIAPGIYFFVVSTPGGENSHGKFVVIR